MQTKDVMVSLQRYRRDRSNESGDIGELLISVF